MDIKSEAVLTAVLDLTFRDAQTHRLPADQRLHLS